MQIDVPENNSIDLQAGRVGLGPLGARMIRTGAALGAVGLVSAVALMQFGCNNTLKYSLFFHAYLACFLFYLSIALGALFFVMLHHLSRAGWSVTLRRLAEGLGANVYLMAILFLPMIPGLRYIYEWPTNEAAANGGSRAVENLYLNPAAFLLRFAVYFAVWSFLTRRLRSESIKQDSTGDVLAAARMERTSAWGMIAFGLTATMAAVDLIMSLNRHWISTIIGVYFFTDAALGGLTAIAFLAAWLRRKGILIAAIHEEHYHDLGKLIFSFVVFWGYIAFSQYMLIWYANMPEETQFFMPRQIGPWAAVSIMLILFHLVIPLVFLLFRRAKRNPSALAFWAAWLLAAQVLDMLWLVMPNIFVRYIPQAVGMPAETPLPEALKMLLASPRSVYRLSEKYANFMEIVRAPLEPASLGLLVCLIVGMGGLFIANTAWALRNMPLIPVKDPRLNEALTHENN